MSALSLGLDAVRGHQARIRTHSGGLIRDWSIPSMHHSVGAGTGQSICMPFWVVKLRRICDMLKKYCLILPYILAFIVCFSRVLVIALELVVS